MPKKREDQKQSKNVNKTKRFKSFFLPYKAAVRIRVGGASPCPRFLDINAFEKALISWVQYFKRETQKSFNIIVQMHKILKYQNALQRLNISNSLNVQDRIANFELRFRCGFVLNYLTSYKIFRICGHTLEAWSSQILEAK